MYKSVKPNDTTNRLEKDKLLELGVELFGPGPDNNWDPLLLATKYEEFRLSVPDQTKKFKFMNAVTVSNFILKACKARASQQALMTDDPSVKVRVDQLLQMDTPTSRVPDLVRTDNVALHVANTSDTMLSESDRTQLSHPPHPQPVNVGEPCPFLVMCQEGTDLIPQHLRRTRTKSGKIAKKKKRQLGDIEVDEKERHCTVFSIILASRIRVWKACTDTALLFGRQRTIGVRTVCQWSNDKTLLPAGKPGICTVNKKLVTGRTCQKVNKACQKKCELTENVMQKQIYGGVHSATVSITLLRITVDSQTLPNLCKFG